MNFSINQSSTSSAFEQAQQKREEQLEKQSSGLRINQAADDAAGLQISNRLTSQINELDQRVDNSRDQINLNNVASAQLSSITDSLQRANELAVQSGNPLYDNSAIQGEFDQITSEINAIAEQALGDSNFVSSLDAGDTTASLEAIETALASVSEQASSLGADSSALSSEVSTYQVTSTNSSAARSQIRDTDYASSTSEEQLNEVLLQASLSIKKTEEERKGLLFDQLV